MLPVAAVAHTTTTPPPLVNTTTPGTQETHPPPNTVAPSFSSPQVDNNARGNSTAQPQRAEQPAPLPSPLAPSIGAHVGIPQSATEKFTLGAQTNFLAQLIGQEITPSVQTVLAQYEKLVQIGNVKYKPSDAQKPQEQPSNLFGKLLEAERAQSPATRAADYAAKAQATTVAAIAAATAEAEPVTLTAAARPLPEASGANRAQHKSFAEQVAEDLAEEEASFALEHMPAPQAPRPSAISAYLSTASRIPKISPIPASPISEVA